MVYEIKLSVREDTREHGGTVFRYVPGSLEVSPDPGTDERGVLAALAAFFTTEVARIAARGGIQGIIDRLRGGTP